MNDTVKRALWTAGQAFVATFLTLAEGLFQAPDLKTARAVAVSAIVAALAAAVSAAKNAIFRPGSPAR